jgi:luciferase-like monooxygenase
VLSWIDSSRRRVEKYVTMPSRKPDTTDVAREYTSENAEQRIVREVSAWLDVTVAPHRFGGVEFRVGRRELGHLHGSRWADLPFPIKVRDELIAAGKAEHHHVMPESGWITVRIRRAADVDLVIELFRMNYERSWRS